MQFDALVGANTDRDGMETTEDGVVRFLGYRATDLTAVAGAVVFVALSVAWWRGWSGLTTVELFLALAMLVVLPLGLGLAGTPRTADGNSRLYLAAVLSQLPAALLTIAGFTYPTGAAPRVALLAPWTALTLTVGLFGLWRLGSHGLTPVSELAIDAAMLYLPVAGVFLLFHALEITFHFPSLIVLLTGIHFHYAGFVLPLVCGLAGRQLSMADRSYRYGPSRALLVAGTAGVLVGNSVIAVAITLSPWIEFPAVVGFVLAITAVAVVVLVELVPQLPRTTGLLLAIAMASLLAGMGLAVLYAYSVFPPTEPLITVSEMVRWHGPLNAVGFAVSALVAFRLLDS